MFLHLFRIDLVIFLLCFCYLYCSKMVYSPSSLPWFANMRFKSSCLLVFTYSLHHCFKTVTSFVFDCILNSYLTFCHKVALSSSVDTGVVFKPCDCICISLMYIHIIFFVFNKRNKLSGRFYPNFQSAWDIKHVSSKEPTDRPTAVTISKTTPEMVLVPCRSGHGSWLANRDGRSVELQ